MTTRKAEGKTYFEVVSFYGEVHAATYGMIVGPLIPCAQPFSRFKRTCPHCGYTPEPAERSTPEQVEGDLAELSPAALAAMRGAIDRADDNFVAVPYGASFVVAAAKHKQAAERKEAQYALRAAMAQWSGYQTAMGREVSEQQRRFWHRFSVDVGTAQTLNASDARALQDKIEKDIDELVNSGLYSA